MRAKLNNFISQQFGKPSGLFGQFIGRGMARNNLYDAEWTISLLDIQPTQHLLEIGFGPGASTQLASGKVPDGFVAGIDHSEAMVRLASQRNASAIEAGKMELKVGEVTSLPFPDESFDTVYSLHSIYFWPNPIDCLKEIKRVLKTGGLLAITIQPKDKWNPKVDLTVMTLYFGKELAVLFAEAGYRNIRVEVPPVGKHKHLECILGVK